MTKLHRGINIEQRYEREYKNVSVDRAKEERSFVSLENALFARSIIQAELFPGYC